MDKCIWSGIIFGFIIIVAIILNIDAYLLFMNVDVSTYKVFTIVSIFMLYFQYILKLVQEKLYFLEENSLSNYYSIYFNIFELILIIILSLVFQNQIFILLGVIVGLSLFCSYIVIKNVDIYKMTFSWISFIKYDSLTFWQYVIFFFTYLLGLSKVSYFGPEFIYVVSFITLITDTQWDILTAIKTSTIINITNKKFVYKKQMRESYIFTFIIILSVIIMGGSLYPFYRPDFLLCVIFLGVHIINFLIYPIYVIKKYLIQLKYSALFSTSFDIANNLVRFSFTFLKTPFCTILGQLFSGISQLVVYSYMYRKFENNKIK